MSRLRTTLVVFGFTMTLAGIVVARPDTPTTSDSAQVATGSEIISQSVVRTSSRGGLSSRSVPTRLPLDDKQASVPAVLSGPTTVATATGSGVLVLDEPEGDATDWFPNPTQFGGPRVFLVVADDHTSPYIEVLLPTKPNGRTGWVKRKDVALSQLTHRALIDLSKRAVTVWDNDDVVLSTGAVIGRETTPTPTGVFYVRDIVPQQNPAGFFGPSVVVLSGFSEALDEYNGGQPAIAVHGTDRPDLTGEALSAGCIRIPNEMIALLAESVPLGTPVAIIP